MLRWQLIASYDYSYIKKKLKFKPMRCRFPKLDLTLRLAQSSGKQWPEFLEKMGLLKHYLDYKKKYCERKE